MSWNGKDNLTASVTESGFTLEVDGRVVPGISWRPADGKQSALVLLGHGGRAHKSVDYIEMVAHGLCQRGIAAMAIDGPGHGDRPGADQWGDDRDSFANRWESDGGTAAMVADWKAALDFIESQHRPSPTGWLGLSMGTMMGLPVCAAEERISAAVLGLMGFWGPNKDDLIEQAPNLSIPLRFLVQADDEVVPRQRCIDLFDALGSERKTMHMNPGAHAAVPMFEMFAAGDYLATQLAKAAGARL